MRWLTEIENEYGELKDNLCPFSSPYEGLSHIQDGISRLQRAVFDRSPNMDLQMAAIAVAAQSLRFLEDCCE